MTVRWPLLVALLFLASRLLGQPIPCFYHAKEQSFVLGVLGRLSEAHAVDGITSIAFGQLHLW